MLTVRQIAWAAGIYEGEGTFSGGRMARVVQKDDWLIYKLQGLFGGYTAVYRGYHTWTVTGIECRSFLLTIFTFLSPRRRQQILKHKDYFTNQYDGKFQPKEFCKHGHEFTDRNTKHVYTTDRVYKSCLICQKVKIRNRRLARTYGMTYKDFMASKN